MSHHYIKDLSSEKGFIEVSESEYYNLVAPAMLRQYVTEVYNGTMSIDEVPEDMREAVQTFVNNRIAHFGEYNQQEISAEELKAMIEGVI